MRCRERKLTIPRGCLNFTAWHVSEICLGHIVPNNSFLCKKQAKISNLANDNIIYAKRSNINTFLKLPEGENNMGINLFEENHKIANRGKRQTMIVGIGKNFTKQCVLKMNYSQFKSKLLVNVLGLEIFFIVIFLLVGFVDLIRFSAVLNSF